jgi:enoyl-CoA hydratase/carnithine racemase
MNRPERLNAMTSGMVEGLHGALGEAGADPECRVVVLTGAGRGFCAGLDLGGYGEPEGVAGAGAVQALLSRALRREMEQTAATIEKVETATEPRFQELFVAAMAFPHGSAPHPHLASLVDLPAAAPTGADGRPRRRRRSIERTL